MKTRQSVRVLFTAQIVPHRGNVREDLGDVSELAASITEHGILQPLVVTETEDPDQFLLLAGHRRLAAARKAGLQEVPVIIRRGIGNNDPEHLVVMLVENCQRRDLNPVEKAEAYSALRNRGLSVPEIARRTGVAAGTVYYYLNLLNLPADELEELRNGSRPITRVLGEARAARQEERLKANGRAVGRPKGRKTTPYFSTKHPLAKSAASLCDHRGVPKVGGVACGACWERAIRDDQAKAVAS